MLNRSYPTRERRSSADRVTWAGPSPQFPPHGVRTHRAGRRHGAGRETGHPCDMDLTPPAAAQRIRAAHLLLAALVVLLLGSGGPGPSAAATAGAAPPADGSGAGAAGPPWRWPLAPPHRVLVAFAAPSSRYGAGHRGVDLAGGGDDGATVTAVAAGTVRFSGQVAGRGVVSVEHPDGLVSTYEPVAAAVHEGQPVLAGTVLGTLAGPGASHCPGTTCLHLGARRGEEYVDPLLLLGARGPSVLLPPDGSRPAPAAAAAPMRIATAGTDGTARYPRRTARAVPPRGPRVAGM